MPRFEVAWAVGGRDFVDADSPADAYAVIRDQLPRGGDWSDIDVTKVK